jgi:hypothetical protein
MDSPIYLFALATMRWLAPEPSLEAEHATLARAMAEVIAEEPPLFRGDADRLRTTSLVLAVAFREGTFRTSVLGDCTESAPGEPCRGRPRSYCTMQVNRTVGGSAELNDDPVLCIRKGLALLRASVHVSRTDPVAWYAAGPRLYTTDRARRISRDRMALARRILEKSR